MSEKILVAQSGVGRRPGLFNLLSRRGYQVLPAGSLAEAVRLLGQEPDLVLLDLSLAQREGMASWEALAKACRAGEIASLVFSSDPLPPERLLASGSWAAGTIERPGSSGEVLAKVAAQLQIRRLVGELNMVRNRLQRQQLEFEAGLRSAAQIQKSLLPAVLPRSSHFAFAWRFIPCEAIGGDLFNILQLDEQTVMVYLLDVSGHGISSAMVSVSVYQSLSLHTSQIIKSHLDAPPFYRLSPPAEVLLELEREYPYERFEKFFTIVYLLLNVATGQARYSSAGHPPPLLLRRGGGEVEALREGGTIIGLGPQGVVPFAEGSITLAPGDRIFLYSDGVTEHLSPAGKMLGEARLAEKLAAFAKWPLKTTCEKTVDVLYDFGNARPFRDDVTLVGFEYLGS